MPGDSSSSKSLPSEEPDGEEGEGDRIEKEILSQIDKAKRKKNVKNWEDDTEDEYEQEYIASLKNEGKQKSYIGAATGGVAAAVGTFVVFTSPLAVAGAAAVGAGTAWKYMRDRGRREVKAAEGDMRTSDHSGDVLGGGAHSGGNGVDGSMLAGGGGGGQRPSLKRLKFLVSWGKLQVEEALPYMQRALNSGDDSKVTLQALRLEKILDEVIMSFSPWVQQQYLVRAEKDRNKQQRGMRLIRVHLAPLYRFLGGELVHKAISFCNAEFLSRWESGEVDPESVLQRCRGTFPTVLETVTIICSNSLGGNASVQGKTGNRLRSESKVIDDNEGKKSRSGSLRDPTITDRRVGDTVQWITTFLRREDVTEFLSSSLVHAHWVHRKASTASRDGMTESIAVKKEQAIDEEEEIRPVEFPPLGAELELDEDQYYSASEGEGSDEETERFRRARIKSGNIEKNSVEVPPRRRSSSSPKASPVDAVDVLESKEGPQESDDEQAENSWDSIDCTTMNVRGVTYFEDRLKQSSASGIMKLESFDLFYTDYEIKCVVEEPHCKAHWLWKQNPKRFFFVVNWRMFPLQLAVTYSVELDSPLFNSDEPYAVAFRRYVEMNDSDRSSKLKVIPRVCEGPWLVKKAVGQTPTIIGRKLETEHHTGDRFVEASIDVFSSVAAKHTLSLVIGAAKKLVIDVGFVIEGQSEDELPERLLGGFRVRYPDLTLTRKI